MYVEIQFFSRFVETNFYPRLLIQTDTVLKGVLHKRDKQHRRNISAFQRVIDIAFYGNLGRRGSAQQLQVDVITKVFDLPGQEDTVRSEEHTSELQPIMR